MRSLHTAGLLSIALTLPIVGCEGTSPAPDLLTDPLAAVSPAHDGPWEFFPPVFDIAATPAGTILVAETVFPEVFPTGGESITRVREIAGGEVRDVVEIATMGGSPINGLHAVGRGSFFATSGGFDLALGGRLFHASPGGARAVADIGAFERENDPDAFLGDLWKDQTCEAVEPYSAGPQTNPYHLTARSGGTALVADAAGNTLLAAGVGGRVELVAVFNPPVDENGEWRVLFPLDEETDCYVQPVPTSVAIGPDGAYYVGELTGVPAVPGWSRVWRIERGASGVVCPSERCREVISGLTSVIDVAFAPDGELYVVEYDVNGWLSALFEPDGAGGGTVKRCDVHSGDCQLVEEGLVLPGAITFDARGRPWVLENGLGAPLVRRVGSP